MLPTARLPWHFAPMSGFVLVLIVAVVVLLAVAFVMGQKSGGGTRPPAVTKTASAIDSGPKPAIAEKVNWLVGTAGEVEGRAFLIGHRTITIGRAPTNFIQVVDEEASRTHTQIQPRDGWLQVVDMNSRNGTLINGTPVTQGRLNVGDELRVGDAKFVFQLRGSFESDAAMGRKEADAKKFTSTVAASGQNLSLMIEAALKETGGDFEAAGKQLGVDPNVLRHIVAQKGINYG